MKLIDAAESGYSTANSYFLLLWGIVAIVGLTAFFELREIDNERTEAARVIGLYEDLIAPVEDVVTALTQVVAAGPHFDDPAKLFAELRANAIRARGLLWELSAMIGARDDLTTQDRIRLNTAINNLLAHLHFNVPAIQDVGMVPIAEEKGLLLAETGIGTIGVAESVTQLRVQDAVRLLWLATVPMRDMMASERDLRRMASATAPGEIAALVAKLEGFTSRTKPTDLRDTARALWFVWTNALPATGDTPTKRLERLAMEQLTLNQPVEQTVQAFRSQSLADARKTGSGVDVSLPGFSLPIRLSDALIFLPIVAGFCLLAIYVYTSRGLRYGTYENLELDDNHQIVGKTPVYFALYGVWKPIGWLIAALALCLPVAITLALPLFLIPSALHADWANGLFWFGLGLDGILLFALILQVSKVTELIDLGHLENE